LVLLISFIALPIHGVIAAYLISKWGVNPVQILDGVGAGMQSVAVPDLVARILDGPGRVNIGHGSVRTVQGLGASLSNPIGGWGAQETGYRAMFLILGSFALGSIALWLGFAPVLEPACGKRIHLDDRRTAPSFAGAR
jgi:MFS family permease